MGDPVFEGNEAGAQAGLDAAWTLGQHLAL